MAGLADRGCAEPYGTLGVVAIHFATRRVLRSRIYCCRRGEAMRCGVRWGGAGRGGVWDRSPAGSGHDRVWRVAVMSPLLWSQRPAVTANNPSARGADAGVGVGWVGRVSFTREDTVHWTALTTCWESRHSNSRCAAPPCRGQPDRDHSTQRRKQLVPTK